MSVRLFIPIALCLVWAGRAEAQYSVGVSAVIMDRVEASAPEVELTRAGNLVLVRGGAAGQTGTALLEAVWLAPLAVGSSQAEAAATWRQGQSFRLEGGHSGPAAAGSGAGLIPAGVWVPVPGGVSEVPLPAGTAPMVVTRVIASNS